MELEESRLKTVAETLERDQKSMLALSVDLKGAACWFEQMAARVDEYAGLLENHQQSMLAYAFAIGDTLISVKETGKKLGFIPHGGFGAWCERNVRVKKQQYAKYMRLARQIPKVQRSVLLNSGGGVDRVYATLAGPGDEIDEEDRLGERDKTPKTAAQFTREMHGAGKPTIKRSFQAKTAVRVANVPEPKFEEQIESDTPPTVTAPPAVEELDAEVEAFRAKFEAWVEALRAEIKAEVLAGLAAELKACMPEMDAEIEADIKALRAEMVAEVRAEVESLKEMIEATGGGPLIKWEESKIGTTH